MFIIGFLFGGFIFEPIIINFVYMRNVALFNDIILTKKSEEKLRRFYNDKFYSNDNNS